MGKGGKRGSSSLESWRGNARAFTLPQKRSPRGIFHKNRFFSILCARAPILVVEYRRKCREFWGVLAGQLVSGSVNCFQMGGVFCSEFFAHLGDGLVYGAGGTEILESPDLIEEGIAVDHLVAVGVEEPQALLDEGASADVPRSTAAWRVVCRVYFHGDDLGRFAGGLCQVVGG